MKVTHGWYERDPNADVFKVLSSVTIELGASERWELISTLSLFIQRQEISNYTTCVKFAKNLQRQLENDPNPNTPFYKEQIKELEEKNKKLLRG